MMMRDAYRANAKRWIESLARYARVLFPGLRDDAREIISDILGEAWEDIDHISERHKKVQEECGRRIEEGSFLYGYLRLEVKRRIFTMLNSSRVKRRARLVEDGEEVEGGYWARPSAVVQPEQEQVVFNKQLIEMCGILPSDEGMVMSLILDRATAEEIVAELGISQQELLRRRARGMRRLADRIGT